jgi:hypothetical protein
MCARQFDELVVFVVAVVDLDGDGDVEVDATVDETRELQDRCSRAGRLTRKRRPRVRLNLG